MRLFWVVLLLVGLSGCAGTYARGYGNEHGAVFLDLAQDHRPDLRLRDRVKARRDLVGNEHARLWTERTQDREPLQLTARELMRPSREPVRLCANRCEKFLRHIPRLAQRITDLPTRVHRLFRMLIDELNGIVAVLWQRCAVQGNRPFLQRKIPRKKKCQCTFAAPARSEKCETLPVRNAQRHIA